MLSSDKKSKWLVQILLLGTLWSITSCNVTKRSVQSIYFPNNTPEVVNSDEESSIVKKLSKRANLDIRPGTDNIKLYSFVNDWLGTPYRFGRMSKKGTDCSGFTYMLYQKVYGGGFKRGSSADLMSQTKKIKRSAIREGDLLFFNINNRRGGRASHVGVYLKDGYFVHASVRQGVIISSLSEPYYKRHYLGAGRLEK